MLDHKKMVNEAMKLPVVSACSECKYVITKGRPDKPLYWKCGVTCGHAYLRNEDGMCRDFQQGESVIRHKMITRNARDLGVMWMLFGVLAVCTFIFMVCM